MKNTYLVTTFYLFKVEVIKERKKERKKTEEGIKSFDRNLIKIFIK